MARNWWKDEIRWYSFCYAWLDIGRRMAEREAMGIAA